MVRLHGWLIAVVLLVAGWLLVSWAQMRFAPWVLDSGAIYRLEGQIQGLPVQDRFGIRLRLRVDCAGTGETGCDIYQRRHPFWPLLVEVTAPRHKWATEPLPGQHWRFMTQVQPLTRQDPFDSFDVARWLRANHVVARFRLASNDIASLLDAKASRLQMLRLSLRKTLETRLDAQSSGPGLSGLPVILALVTGDRALMAQEHWRIFNHTGTTHLVAISGSHVMLVTAVVVFLLQMWVRRWLWLTHRIPAINLSLLLGWLVALAYGGLAGLEFPVQRALIMLTLVVAFKWWGRAQPLWIGWVLAFLLVILWDPMAVYSLGFWLSFIAVYWILWIGGGIAVRTSKWLLWARVQWAIFFGLAPVLLWQLQSLSLVSSFTNAFAIPLIGTVLTPLALLWALGWSLLGDLADPLLWLANGLAELSILLLQWCADLPLSLYVTTPHSAGTMLLALVGVVWLCTAGIPARWLAPLLLLPLLKPDLPPAGVLIQGDAATPRLLIATESHLASIGVSEWPRLDNRWQQNWLRFHGIAPAAQNLPLHNTADYWQAAQWTVSVHELQKNRLGMRSHTAIRYRDLCKDDQGEWQGMQWQKLQQTSRSGQCNLLLTWQDQGLLLLNPASLKSQTELLQLLKDWQQPVQRVLLHPRRQDRWLPALLQYWQRQGTEILLSGAVDDVAVDTFQRAGLPVIRLAESPPLTLPFPSSSQ